MLSLSRQWMIRAVVGVKPRLGVILCLTLGLCLPASLAVAAQPATTAPDLLKAKPWTDSTYGLSMRPPKGMQLREQSNNQAIVEFTDKTAAISLFVRSGGGMLAFRPVKDADQKGPDNSRWRQRTRTTESPKAITREFLRKRGRHQLSFLYPKARQLADDQPNLTIAGHKATKLYFLVENNAGRRWVVGQAYVILDRQRVAVAQLECDVSTWQQQKRRFEAMLKSVRITDPAKLKKRRAELIEAGHAWHTSLNADQINRVLPDEQWYRITRDGQDVGYMRMHAQRTTDGGQKGIHLTIQKRRVGEKVVYDTVGEFFLSAAGQQETWDLKTTQRPKAETDLAERKRLPAAGQEPHYPTWIETGVCDQKRIIITHLAPTAVLQEGGQAEPGQRAKKKQWPRPPKAYLSQVALRLYLPLLPHKTARQMLFYAYDNRAGHIALRRVHIQPLSNDRFAVRVKPTPTQGENVSIYGKDGQLIRRRMPDGRIIKPTNAAQLKRLWNLQ
jgi:hypothetical protein